jgi:thiol:disulfide interchange protein
VTLKKALGILLLLAILIFVGLWLINAFLPNPYTLAAYTFITVTAPAYVMEKWEAFAIGAGAAIAGIGKVMSSATKKVDEAKAKVADAEKAKSQAETMTTAKFEEVDKLTAEKKVLQDQVTEMQSTRTEAEKLLGEAQSENTALKRQNQELLERLENPQVKIVEVVK